jgi:hypothetical protein
MKEKVIIKVFSIIYIQYFNIIFLKTIGKAEKTFFNLRQTPDVVFFNLYCTIKSKMGFKLNTILGRQK